MIEIQKKNNSLAIMDLNDDWSQDGPEVRGEDDDEEDEFEREMEQELLTRAENARQVSGLGSSSVSDPHPSGSKPKSTGSSSKYDDIYFDSDEEETDQRKMQTNDDLFYDPNMDDDDQKWVDQVRDDYINKDRKRYTNCLSVSNKSLRFFYIVQTQLRHQVRQGQTTP